MAILAFGLHRFAIRGNMDGISFVNSNPKHMFAWGGGNLYIKCNKMEAKPINVKYAVGVP
ncbi:hypothetical protein SAMN05444406_10913 [Caldicoprobacter faecalis]|uniref:Uncharacterized protein n=1 Tax=Caldicoprobacter faecalis TaxID=937334 RepID=A0A1I5UY83_9FIRM|nr:hypothetical protein SAMN05444406_10913 [Caldicoprobacter faecalis]